MTEYYRERLSALRLKQCYDIAPPRVLQYMQAELDFVSRKIKPGDRVLELGCGYGRALLPLSAGTGLLVGIDNSFSSLQLAQALQGRIPHLHLALMDAAALALRDAAFQVVVCIQNGISAFHVDREKLIRDSFRLTAPGGVLLFSTYSPKFWTHRLEWFHMQAKAGLLGEIDEEKTGHGVIVCKDGFTAFTVDEGQFLRLTAGLKAEVKMTEVDESSLFCEIRRL